MPLKVFAYGTLITGALDREVEALLRRSLLARHPARLRGRLYDLGDYPAAVPTAHGREHIMGELLVLTGGMATLAVLDAYEDHSPECPERGLFRRRRATVQRRDTGGRERALVYWYNAGLARARRIPGGDWRHRAFGQS
ncbi:gamma-glutamylcyclotransferase family protein [Arhodomonas sp. SL1]|uniref:gamma-glutamylcyclotransferase family protein n=1 Tax=Arhodomonas sp. SL1 TaxID=3425691 RepID=UPI003F885D78